MAGTILRVRANHPQHKPCLNGVRPRWPEQSQPTPRSSTPCERLNGVRPSWPEQSWAAVADVAVAMVSMESGLVGRNNDDQAWSAIEEAYRLNGVRPSWPEQSGAITDLSTAGLTGLNGVRPSWPEQFDEVERNWNELVVSMESGLVGRNNIITCPEGQKQTYASQWSPA